MPVEPRNSAKRSQLDAAAAERALFRDAQSGDRGAFGKIVSTFQDRVYNSMLRLVGDSEEARDLTQESFVKALSKISTFRGDAQPFTWLYRIAMNLGLTHLSNHKRRRTFSLDHQSNGAAARRNDDQAASLLDRIEQSKVDSPSEAALRRERQQQVLAALGRLDPANRALLVLRDVDGMDYQAMADVLEMPLGTLKSKLFRARLALREELKPYWAE